MSCLENMIEKLNKAGIYFTPEYYGVNDYGTFWDVKSVLENKDYFQSILTSSQVQDIEFLSEYLDYLCLRKLVLFQEMISALKSDEDKQTIQSISDLANEQYKKIGNDILIRFINKNFQEIFKQEYHQYSLPHITLELIIPFQNGITHEVFEYLAKDYNYLLLGKFQNFQKRFEKEPELFKLLFHHKNLEEMRKLRLDCVLPIFVTIWNGNNTQLKSIIEPIIENVINDMESLVKNTDLPHFRDILIIENLFRQVYDFIQKIKHPKANEFCEYSYYLKEKLKEDLKEHGQEFSYKIPVGEIIKLLKKQPNCEIQMLSLTHDKKIENDKLYCVSRLAYPSKGKQGLIDFISSNISSDDYFTHSHQNWLEISMSVGAATILAIWHDKELFPDCLQWYFTFLGFISEQTGCIEGLDDDLEILHTMLEPVILSDDKDKKEIQPFCYGAAMFICALIEKLLRIVYIYLLKDRMYVPLTSATLGALLSPHNQEMANIFGEDHLKNLSYFICTVGEKKIGWNIRNSLAHWAGVDKNSLSSMLVAQLFYLYTDIINTIFWYFFSLTEDK